jgi:hypothetical protein
MAVKHYLYGTHRAMLQRCTNPNAVNYQYYGGKGITVCDRWSNFQLFLEDMGDRPEGTTLDRIDPTGNYEPSNCRWATNNEQRLNRGSVRPNCRRNVPNRDNPLHHISKDGNGYRVCMELNGKRVRKFFLSLDDALEFRSELEMEREMHKLLGLK